MHFSEFLHRETRVQQHLAYQDTLLILDYPVVRFVSVVQWFPRVDELLFADGDSN
jgi:hypothetical protein